MSKVREVAVKAHQCLQKHHGSNGSEVDKDVQGTFGGSILSLTLFVETTEKASLSPPKRVLFPLKTCELRGNIG